MKRASGVLLHITSLPGEYGIGSLGKDARKFVDFLRDCGFTYWQILPVTEPDEYYSPYKSPSAFAGSPFLIDLDQLCGQGLLSAAELAQSKQKSSYACEYDRLSKTRMDLLRTAYSRIDSDTRKKTEQFTAANKWLAEYSEYMATAAANGSIVWQEWDKTSFDQEDADFYCYLQYEFFRQWYSLKEYANKNGIRILGDMPLYLSLYSADVYHNKGIFKLDSQGYPLYEAGVPPDGFSDDGQAWECPVYDWDALRSTGYRWWFDRIEHSLRMFDTLRIDHFRGLSEYWEIPAGKKPIDGSWKKGPGQEFFRQLKKIIPNPDIIAEDLGFVTKDVADLLEYTGFPGMRIIQFAFSGDGAENIYLPHNYIENSVAYTGTHDNNTLLGWLWELTPSEREYALKYCGFTDSNWSGGGEKSGAVRAIIRSLYQSPSAIVILPIQDLCGYGRDTRMNTPGVSKNNWSFRITWDQINKIDQPWCAEMNRMYGRDGVR
ncbi:MAG: 4-alpha-glucanotransferase [Oscillospiraceae bacterium]|nr:4-alpha-glucanotransferase [Oscillospiraceae bacterium]